MEFHQVKYFLALSETLNFTRAAEKCNISQPSLTRAIQSLEAELGGPLFHRERQRTHLTELGRLMQPYFQQMSAQSQAARTLAKSFVKLEDATLKIGVMCTISPAMLGELIAAFRERHPGVEVEVLDAAGSVLGDMLLSGEIEVAIYGLPEGIDERFHAMALFRERFVIAVAPTHRFVAQDAVRCRDLHRERYVNRANCEFGEHAGAVLQQLGVAVEVVLRSDRDDWIQAMILAGLGFGFFPEYSVTLPGIVIRPLVEPEMVRTICLVSLRGRPHSPAVGAFVRQVRSHPWPERGVPLQPVAEASPQV